MRAEYLEQRQLLAANTIVFDAATSAIVIEGTAGADSVAVWSDAANVVHARLESPLGAIELPFLGSTVAAIRFLGGEGNDRFENFTSLPTWAWGGGGNDTLIGGAGGDYFYGGAGDDVIVGNAGIDTIYGEDGNDQLSGGDGNDALYGGAGNNELVGGLGDDQLIGGDAQDSIFGNDGNDYIVGNGGNDLLYGGAGNDRLEGGLGDDTLFGGSGDDHLLGDYGHDHLYGEDGNDWLAGAAGNDELDGGLGDDALLGGAGDDQLTGGDGHDDLYGDEGNDWLRGGDGNDILRGGIGDDHLYGGAGNDQLLGDDGHDLIYGEEGNDYIVGGAGNDLISGGLGENLLYGGLGDDHLLGDSGNDRLDGEEGNDYIVGGAGNDLLYGGAGDDRLEGGLGDDSLSGGAGNDQLIGGDGHDILYGEEGNDWINAGDGHDIVRGGIGDDSLLGGAGNDQLLGEDGHDLIYGDDGNDYIVGGTGNDVIYGGLGDNTLYGGLGDDQLLGDSGQDTIYGEEGNDYIVGGAGNDLLYGGAGDDRLEGGFGDDSLHGGADADQLIAGDGHDIVYGDDGNDWLVGGDGNDNLYGGAGNNQLHGGRGDDQIAGGDAQDWIYGDDGNDYILGLAGNDHLYGGAGKDRIEAGLGDDRLFGGDGNDELFGNDGNDNIQGDDGNDWLVGGAGNDQLDGGLDDDLLAGGAGNDLLLGRDGHDSLHGDEGNDLLNAGAGNDRLEGGLGDDVLMAGSGDDSLYGDGGLDILLGGEGNDVLAGLAGPDVLVGGAGDDKLFGGASNDVLVGGIGQDELYGDEGDDLLVGGTTVYDADAAALRALTLAWSSATPYASRIQQIEDQLFLAHLGSEHTVFDDQIADSLFGGGEQDWFFLTGYLAAYRPADVVPDQGGHNHGSHSHSQIILSELPALEGFALIDSLDKLDRQANESIHSLVPHAAQSVLQREHLALFDLVRYDQLTHIAIRSGAWSNAATWRGGQVPTAGAKVLIPIGVEVNVYDVITTRLSTVRVDGTLSFDHTRNTELRADTVVVSASGAFEMGTQDNPVVRGATARLLFTDNGPINRTWDPFGISRGLISHGRVSIYGAAVDSYAALSGPVTAGLQTLTLKSIPIGWKAGDDVVIAGTTSAALQNETRKILAITANSVILDRPLSFSHLTPSSDLDVHIANVTRNAVIESESTAVDRRGHVMFMHNRDVDVAYAGFYRLGRTDKLRPVNDSVVQSDWTLKAGTGTNQRGRYSVHFHRNGLTNDGNPSTVIGSAVVDSAGWGFVNHSGYVDFTFNVAYDVHGAAFATEVGDEIGGFYGNLAVGTTGSHEAINAREAIQDFGHQGDGFWFQGAGVSIVGNISAGNQENAFVFYNRGLYESPVQARFPAANLSNPAIAGGAETIAVEHVPMVNFSSNVGYSSETGLLVRYHLEDSPHSQYSVFQNSKFWNNNTGVSIPYAQNTVLRNLTVINGQVTALPIGVYGNLLTANIVYENLTVTGYNNGIELPQWGNNVVNGGTFNNLYDIVIPTAAVRNRTILLTGELDQPRIFRIDDTSPIKNGTAVLYFIQDSVYLDFGPFANQRLYSLLQRASAIPFPVARADVPAAYVGLTNQQLWNQFGVAIGGAIAPSTAFTVPYITGLIAPLI